MYHSSYCLELLLLKFIGTFMYNIIIIFIIISFMQDIYTYTPETNYVPREYSVAAILLLLFMVLISLVSVLNLLYFYISTFRSMCALLNTAVFCSYSLLLLLVVVVVVVVVVVFNKSLKCLKERRSSKNKYLNLRKRL